MNVKQTQAAIRALGFSAARTDGEWRINVRGREEALAYYTTDNEDALGTAKAWATRREAAMVALREAFHPN